MTLYETVVDTAAINSSHSVIAALVGHDRSVLDVGCSSGYLATALREQGCTVSGIEYDPESAERARPLLRDLVVGDLNTLPLAEAFAGKSFDRIVFGDVLEHLSDPAGVLRSATEILAPGGEVVLSIPNVAHGSVRLALLQGSWAYRDTGLLDRTHIKFFTFDGVERLLDEAGLVATEIRAVVLDPLAVEVEVDQARLPQGVVDWVRHQPHASTYQFVLRARPASAEGEPRSRTVVPVAEVEVPLDGHVRGEVVAAMARLVDQRNAESAQAAVSARHDLLTARDNAIGLENTALLARAELAGARQDIIATHKTLRGVLDENIRLDGVIRSRDAEINKLRGSRAFRVGFAVLHPVAWLKGVRG